MGEADEEDDDETEIFMLTVRVRVVSERVMVNVSIYSPSLISFCSDKSATKSKQVGMSRE